MLSLDPKELMREVLASAKARNVRREGIQAMLDKFPGSWWNGVPGDGQFDPDNAGFEMVSYLATQLVWSNPRVSVTTKRPGPAQQVAEAMHWGMNRWIVDGDLKTTLEDFVVDYLYGWCIAHVTLAPKAEMYEAEDPPLWPQVSRFSPDRFGWDHLCPTWRQARILWHEWWADQDDMIERAKRDGQRPESVREGWDRAAIEDLKTTPGNLSLLGAQMQDPQDYAVDRKQVRFVTVYLPGRQLDGEPGPREGFNGTQITLGCAPGGTRSPSDGVIVAPPRPCFAPRWGPYVIGGTYAVPDRPHPLSVILANAGHIERATRVGRAVDEGIKSYAKMAVTSDTTIAELMNDGQHTGIYTTASLGDLAGKLVSIEKGGVTQQMLEARQLVRADRDRALGMDDVQRGVVTGDATATEVAEASQAAGARVAQIKSRYQDFVRRILKTVGYYLFSTDEVTFTLGEEASEAMGAPPGHEALFEGGSFEAGSGVTYDDLGLEIEPFSMERPSDQTKVLRASFYTNVLPVLAPALPQLAAAGWKIEPLLRAVGDAYAIPNLEKGVDMAKVMEASQNPNPDEDPLPRFLRDVGTVKAQAGRLGASRPTGRTTSPGAGPRALPPAQMKPAAMPAVTGIKPTSAQTA